VERKFQQPTRGQDILRIAIMDRDSHSDRTATWTGEAMA